MGGCETQEALWSVKVQDRERKIKASWLNKCCVQYCAWIIKKS